jgi:hypothetical protein
MNRDICEHGNPEPCDKCKPVPPPEAKTEAEYTHSPRQWQTLSDEEIYPLLVSSAAQELIERGKREALEPEQAEPVAWRTFDGEGGYDYRTYDDNENYRDEWDRRNPNHKGWVEPLYTHSPRQWQTLSDEEIYGSFRKSGLEAYHQRDAVVQYDYDRRINAFARAVEEKLRAKNSTLACIPAVPPG